MKTTEQDTRKFSMVDILCKRFYFRKSKVVLGELDVVIKFKPLFCEVLFTGHHTFCEKVDDYYKAIIPGWQFTTTDVVDLLDCVGVEETFDLSGKLMAIVLDDKGKVFDLGEPECVRALYPNIKYLENKGEKCQ